MTKKVLGLFDKEDDLRDYLAQDLTIIEPGLQLIDKNFDVRNPHGASGTFDILGRDKHNNFVIIEVKRSDSAARHALHELAKYIALFMEDQKVDSHKIRCFVVSTHWHELDVPLSFFKDTCPVDVTGFEVTAPAGVVTVAKRQLPKVSLESRLSPDIRFVFFESMERRDGFCKDLQKALDGVKNVRAALLVMDPIADLDYMCLLCTWRVPDIAMERVKTMIFNPDFQEEHYLFPGWELETDLCDWLEDQSDKPAAVWPADVRATPEKVENYKEHHLYTRLIKLGDWPAGDLVTDLQEVLRCLVAKDVSGKSNRANQHRFQMTSNKSTGKAWEYANQAFKEFIGNNDFWLAAYDSFAEQIPADADVRFEAYRMRHFYYAVHQAVKYPEAELTTLGVTVTGDDGLHIDMLGLWLWDGVTRPRDALANIERTYGSAVYLSLMLFKANDTKDYDAVYKEHGFFPYVAIRSGSAKPFHIFAPKGAPPQENFEQRLPAFVAENADYCNQVSVCLQSVPRNFADPD
jgi:hypothetical protein